MADYIYLLETRLSKDQRAAIEAVRGIARAHELTAFLVGGAIRDLISGAPVRDLDVAVQGNALKLKKDLEKAGAEISSELLGMQALHVRFPAGVRMEVGSTLTTTFAKPGRVSARPATILDDLRRRDFTANAMALSLNEGSYGLLMDPLNGVADIENRELRLVSNYGFIEDPVRLLRAARLMARLGWHLDARTQARYETAKDENSIAALQPIERAYETEEVFHEEDPVRVMRALEEQGWLGHLSPMLSVSNADLPELKRLRDMQMQLQEQGIIADAAAANFPLLTTQLSAKEAAALRESFPRRAFVHEIEALEGASRAFATQLAAKAVALPSQAYRLMMETPPVVVLWTAYANRNAAVQAKFHSFLSDWPVARQRVPYLLMQEMRITPEISGYDELLEKIAFAAMDGLLETPEATRSFLEPYSPPAPPPPISLRRPRAPKAAKKEPRAAKGKKVVEAVSTPGDDAAETSAASQAGPPSHAPRPMASVTATKGAKQTPLADPESTALVATTLTTAKRTVKAAKADSLGSAGRSTPPARGSGPAKESGSPAKPSLDRNVSQKGLKKSATKARSAGLVKKAAVKKKPPSKAPVVRSRRQQGAKTATAKKAAASGKSASSAARRSPAPAKKGAVKSASRPTVKPVKGKSQPAKAKR